MPTAFEALAKLVAKVLSSYWAAEEQTLTNGAISRSIKRDTKQVSSKSALNKEDPLPGTDGSGPFNSLPIGNEDE